MDTGILVVSALMLSQCSWSGASDDVDHHHVFMVMTRYEHNDRVTGTTPASLYTMSLRQSLMDITSLTQTKTDE